MKQIIQILCSLAVIFLVSCSGKQDQNKEPDQQITSEGLVAHIKTLASDEFLGRKPFTRGEELTINYIREQFQLAGLSPATGDTYFQDVPLVEINASDSPSLSVTLESGKIEFSFRDDFVLLTRRVVDNILLENSEMIFAGYGVIAPEYNWNDYDGLDVKGKTVVVLVNDPGFFGDNDTFFKGKAMTYYGRWTYKYEEAARQGAAAILIIHDTEPASYPWGVVESGWTGANLYLRSENNNLDRCMLEGWITNEKAKELFTQAGYEDYDFYYEARKGEFNAFSLNASLSASLSNSISTSTSYNVAGLIPGTERPEEVIVYSSHWDHMGTNRPVQGDSIWNGAIDNASGIATIIEIAKAMNSGDVKPKRSVLFLAVTAEEQGLLGSEYYSTHPIFPPNKTVANINIDALHANGPMKDVTIVGYGQSELDEVAGAAAKKQGRYVLPDPNPGKGSFFRSDHFNFGKVGIPALYAKGGYEHSEKGIEYAEQMSKDYESNRYHKPADEYNENWDMRGMVEDARLFYQIGIDLSNSSNWPKWKEGSEFKAIREQSMNE